MTTKTTSSITAEPFLTPKADDDPMGVYRFEPFATQLQQEFDAIEYPDPDTEEALEDEQQRFASVHAKNEAYAAHIVRCVNEREGLLDIVRELAQAIREWNDSHDWQPEDQALLKRVKTLLGNEA
jgi:hypothetical protein